MKDTKNHSIEFVTNGMSKYRTRNWSKDFFFPPSLPHTTVAPNNSNFKSIDPNEQQTHNRQTISIHNRTTIKELCLQTQSLRLLRCSIYPEQEHSHNSYRTGEAWSISCITSGNAHTNRIYWVHLSHSRQDRCWFLSSSHRWNRPLSPPNLDYKVPAL